MSQDRFVWFKDKFPSKKDIENILNKYISGAGEVEWNEEGNRFYVTLKGAEDRWFEVYYGCDLTEDESIEENRNIDIITRMADEFTSVVAVGFANLVARYWNGTLDE